MLARTQRSHPKVRDRISIRDREHTLLEPGEKPVMVEGVPKWSVWDRSSIAFKGMLDGNLATVVLAEKRTHDRPRL